MSHSRSDRPVTRRWLRRPDRARARRDTAADAVELATTWTCESLEARTLLSAQWQHPAFAGNPYVPVSAISATAHIDLTRTSGELPFFVQASASNVTATGTGRAYEDLEYRWDFGDGGGTEVTTSPADGRTVNANADQTGPEAAYVYRTAGTYTITLTARGRTSSGTYVTRTYTQTVTASAFGGTHVYYDPDAPTDGTGASPSSPHNVIPQNIPANTWVDVKRGTVDERTTPLLIGTHTRITAYGSGADPVIEQRGAGNVALSIANGAGSKADIVVSGIDVRNTAAAGGAPLVRVDPSKSGTNTIADVYFDGLDLNRTGGTAHLDTVEYVGQANPLVAETGFWNTRVTSTGVGRHGIYGLATNWSFVVGGGVSGSGVDNEKDHHIYPQVQNHALYRWIEFGAGPNRNYDINTNTAASGGSPSYARFHLIADNLLTGTRRAVDASNGSNDPSINRFADFVIQGNAVTGLTANGQFYWFGLERGTLRDNAAWDNVGTLMSLDDPGLRPITQPKVYDNLAYGNFTATDPAIRVQGLQQAYVVRDNTVYSTATVAGLVRANPSTKAAGTTFDANRWYAPNDADSKFLYDADAGTMKSFADWQAAGMDPNGSTGDPGWVDPANGDFRTAGLAGLTLIDAAADTVIGPMTSGAVLDMSNGQTFSVRADPAGTIGSVVFALDGTPIRTESVAPYAVAGDNVTDYFAWNVASGPHTLTATPHSGSGGTGTALPGITVSFTAVHDPVTVTAGDDAYVRAGASAGTNYGSDPALMVKESVTTDNDRQAYVKFDVSQFAGAATAVLRLHGYVADGATSGTAAVFGVADTTWTEGGLTWNTRPAAGGTALATTTINAAGASSAAWFDFDVTAYVRAAVVAGAQYVSFAVKSSTQDEVRMVFDSSETANGPQLVVT